MRLLVIDPGAGVSGNMMCGALLAAGADYDTVLCAMRSIDPELSVSRVVRCGIPAWYVETHTKPVRRTFIEMQEIVRSAEAPTAAIDLSEQVFSRIVTAEEKVCGTHHVHLPDGIGAYDAIADVLGACTAFVTLGVDAVHILPLPMGFRARICVQETMQIPVLTTAEILRNSDLQVAIGDFPGEQCTPTGVALLAQFSTLFGTDKHTGRITAVGWGAGSHEPTKRPNVLLAMVMEAEKKFFPKVVDVLETNMDDISGELLPEIISFLMEAGARDAYLVPVTMKKGRPGYIIRVIADPSDSERLARMLARETGSLGIRCMSMTHRFVADRRISPETVVVNGDTFVIDVKTAFMDGKPYSRKAEFDQVRDAAGVAGVPIRDMKRVVEERTWKEE